MNINKSKLLTGLSFMSSGLIASVPALARDTYTNEEKPNILIIYTDDMGIGDLSCYNTGWTKTPNLDQIASEGLIINNYYSAAPVSSASRVGLTTGMFPLQWGINTYLSDKKHNSNCEQFDYLSTSAPSMARILKDAGYNTGHFGKWHMGGGRDVKNAPQITEYGFDEYISTWESPDPDPVITGSTWIWSDKDEVKRWSRTAYFVDKTLDFLSRHKGEPCFVNLWPDDMHTPWVQDEEAAGKRKTWESQPNFHEVLIEYDIQMGRLMEGLKKLGIDKNTIVIFTSDNGPAPSFKQIRANGLRGTKNSLYEGGIRMPFMVRWPNKIKAGEIDKTSLIFAADLLPSLCKIAGANLPKGHSWAGEDMSKVLIGKPQKRKKDMMWDFGRNKYFAQLKGANRSPHLALRRGNWKLLMNSDGTQIELYNMAKDENEAMNVAESNPKVVKELSKALLEWWAKRLTPEKNQL